MDSHVFLKIKNEWIDTLELDSSCVYLKPFYDIKPSDVKVVFIGTSLISDESTDKIFSEELCKVYQTIKKCGYYPTIDGNLTRWVKQGVLIMHKDTPMYLIQKMMDTLSDNVIFVFKGTSTSKGIPFETPFLFKKINGILGQDLINW